MDYLDFVLRIGPGEGGVPSVRVSSPAGEARGRLVLPFPSTQASDLVERVARAVCAAMTVRGAGLLRQVEPADPRAVGAELFAALFHGPVLELFHESLGLAAGQGRKGLRIRLVLEPELPEHEALASLPWELLATRDGPLCLRWQTPVVRYLDVPRPVDPPRLEGPLRTLVVMSSPAGFPPLDLPRERAAIEGGWGKEVGVEVAILERPTLAALHDALRDGAFHAVHFMGHGDFDPRTGAGVLVLEDDEGRAAPVSGELLARHLDVPHRPALVVLNACDTAHGGSDPFGGVAAALVRGGLLAVVAMQFPISDRAALAFSAALYRRLAAGDPAEAAVGVGRLAIHADDAQSFEWATPVLFLRTATGRVFELPFVTPSAIREAVQVYSSDLWEKTRGFVGRKFVFDAVAGFLGREPRGYFLLTGEPGVGKTAFLTRMVELHGHPHHFNIRTQGLVSPDAFLRSICAQLIAAYRLDYTTLPDGATRDATFFRSLLDKVAQRLRPGEKSVLLVDALDESDRTGMPNGANTLYLPETLPTGVYLVATTRPKDIRDYPLRISCEQTALYLDPLSDDNRGDIEEYLRAHLADPGIRAFRQAQGQDEEGFVHLLLDRSEGNFMYLRWVLPEIAQGTYTERELPQGLAQYYEDHWVRMRNADEEVWLASRLPVLMALTVVREPISLEQIARYSGVRDLRRVQLALKGWKAFLHEAPALRDGREEKVYRLYHLSFLDFLQKKDEIELSFRQAHERILDAIDLDALDG